MVSRVAYAAEALEQGVQLLQPLAGGLAAMGFVQAGQFRQRLLALRVQYRLGARAACV